MHNTKANTLINDLCDEINVLPMAAKVRGRDLFDVDILAQLATQPVFYQFAAALKHRICRIRDGSRTHRFLRRLNDRGLLIRCYTQNVDHLEQRVGLHTAWTSSAASDSKGSGASYSVIQLHGDIMSLRCTICAYRSPWTDEIWKDASEGIPTPCPDCRRLHTERVAKGKRTWTIGTLRPDIILYGEEHPDSTWLAERQHEDIELKPDVLLVMGTALKVPGCRQMVQEFARVVHERGGRVICVNCAGVNWKGVIDDDVRMASDAWVTAIEAEWTDNETQDTDIMDEEVVQDHPDTSDVEMDEDMDEEVVQDHLEASDVEMDADVDEEVVQDHLEASDVDVDEDIALFQTTSRQRWRAALAGLRSS